ncbi:MAG TPA: hypothetical protein VEI97_13565 [bacterium]|nr:hypothetical protein [bacterium]
MMRRTPRLAIIAILIATPAVAQDGAVAREVLPGYSLIAWVAGVVFALSIVKGVMDIFRPLEPGVPPPESFTTVARWATLVTCIFGLLMVVGVLGGIPALLGLAPVALGVTIGQVLIALAVWLRPGQKMALRIVATVIALLALAILPTYLGRMGAS